MHRHDETYGASTATAPRRRNASGTVTRELIVTTGERLFAANGIEAISLREIGAACGQANTAAVKYHFGDKQGLLRAILVKGTSAINEARERILRTIDRLTVDTIAMALVQPMIEQVRDGKAYPEFLQRMILEYRVGGFVPWATIDATTSWQKMIAALPHLTPGQAQQKLALALSAALACLSGRQINMMPGPLVGDLPGGDRLLPLDAAGKIAIAAAAAAIGTPLPAPSCQPDPTDARHQLIELAARTQSG